MDFLKYMAYRVLAVILILIGVSFLLYGIIKNLWIAVLGFLMIIASKYFATTKTKKKEN